MLQNSSVISEYIILNIFISLNFPVVIMNLVTFHAHLESGAVQLEKYLESRN